MPGSDCIVAGVVLASLPLLPGYWRFSRESTDVRRCPDAAKKADSGCTGVAEAPCKPGLNGTYCTLCESGNTSTYYSVSDSKCFPCGHRGLVLPLMVGMLVATLVGLLLCSAFSRWQRVLNTSRSTPPAVAPDLQGVQLLTMSSISVPASSGAAPRVASSKVATPLPLTAAEAHSTRFGFRWFSLARAALASVLGLVPVLATPLKIVWSFYQVITQARDQPSECPLTL